MISLFVELVVQKFLRGYELKILSGYQVYDGLYEYQLDQNEEVEYSEKNRLGIYKNVFNANGGSLKKEILVEFKKELNSIYKDINSNKKDIGGSRQQPLPIIELKKILEMHFNYQG